MRNIVIGDKGGGFDRKKVMLDKGENQQNKTKIRIFVSKKKKRPKFVFCGYNRAIISQTGRCREKTRIEMIILRIHTHQGQFIPIFNICSDFSSTKKNNFPK
jgi:hypothetical protein